MLIEDVSRPTTIDEAWGIDLIIAAAALPRTTGSTQGIANVSDPFTATDTERAMQVIAPGFSLAHANDNEMERTPKHLFEVPH